MNKKSEILKKGNYDYLINDISSLLETARKTSVKTINSILTFTYWKIGRRIVEYEYKGKARSEYYGEKLLENLSNDLQKKYGRGFSRQNIQIMKQFYEIYNYEKISQTAYSKSLKSENISQTLSSKSTASNENYNSEFLSNYFSLPWSHYVLLIRRIKDDAARGFYETEANRNGWSVRQLDRQISSQFYERVLLSKNKSAILEKTYKTKETDQVTLEEEIKDPYILEFLDLKDEYSENELEQALIIHLEKFLLELGGNFAFVGRQKRLRIGNEWFRIDLLFFHRKLKCLVVIDLKVGKFTHSDAG